ncbi:branched-chain amino acid ABC transporter permease [Actinophytocola algeriensis]|uniref:Branched-chain amino acid transport system permease protein n=1 Tax=Actinophytocola algeriensis TaxID=1768010 RepID=A0A7W7VHJ4_9PSEU|nr:branched-chain amino acid ABC transporter permease [Actinophytocola algeriensis]MBB4910483.1 branched-chain amino acid transport system permease protein [Actinophytocola algeriensis]MBE1480528.1 branched-chain amino acid transport system permease protein [Actinophytocola algeriensis]
MTATLAPPSARPVPARKVPWGRYAGIAVVAVLLVVYPLVAKTSFLQTIGVTALTMAIASTGWNILGGYAGQISFGHAVFFGTGMYGTTLLVTGGWSPWLTMMPIALLAAVLGVLIGLPTFRLRGHYFSIATLAIGMMVMSILPNIQWLGATDGLSVPFLDEGFWNLTFSLRDKTEYYYTALGLFAVATVAAWLFLRGRIGSYLEAIRDDDVAASAVGVPVRRYKLYAVAMSAALTSIAGSFHVMFVTFVDPSSSSDLSLSTAIALIAVVGGAGSMWGPILGAWLVIALQEYTRTYLSATGRTIDLMMFGALIILVAVVDPRGLVNLVKRGYRRVRR